MTGAVANERLCRDGLSVHERGPVDADAPGLGTSAAPLSALPADEANVQGAGPTRTRWTFAVDVTRDFWRIL